MTDQPKQAPATEVQRKSARRNALDYFTAAERRDTEVRQEIARSQAATAAQTAKLRALRLAKEEADRIEALNAPVAEKPAANPRKKRARPAARTTRTVP